MTKLVTADSFSFVSNETGENEVPSALIRADQDDCIYVKVYYTGVNLDSSTITLKSTNDNILFKNGTNEMSLSLATSKITGGQDDIGKFNLYEIPLAAPLKICETRITISAIDGAYGIEDFIDVSSVYIMTNNKIDVNAKSSNVRDFESESSFNFAISKGEFAEFAVVDGNSNSKTISKIELTTQTVEGEGFGTNVISQSIISNSVFVVTARIGGKTQVLSLKVYYYVLDKNEEIKEESEVRTIQIAVYEAIGNIGTVLSEDKIGYVNPYFTETSSTELTFSSYTSNYGTPASSVTFTDGEQNSASQIQVKINNYYLLKNSKDLVSITFVSNGDEIDLLNSETTVLTQGETDSLEGKIKVQLLGTIEGIDEISLSLVALRFGIASSIMSNVLIKIEDVTTADKILVSGDEFVELSDASYELRMSFIDVAGNGYDEVSFNASLQFSSLSSNASSLRFDDIETGLTHVLYKYELDEDGYITSKVRVQDNFFDVIYSNGKVTIRAYKNLGGGLFRLVLATKDSYNLKTDPTKIAVEEENFNTTYPITVRVSDGEIGSEYIIEKAEELNYINYNLDKNFVLGANIDVSGMNFSPLGLIGSTVYPFTGSFDGTYSTVLNNEQSVTSSYSITLHIKNVATSDEFGNVAGLFAIIGENAVIKNLTLVASYADDFSNNDLKGIKIGALAGVNNGTIENVVVSLNSSSTTLNVSAGAVDFGGIVGLNRNIIKKSKVECLESINISAIGQITHNVGLMAGTNESSAQIVGSYVGKSSLNNFVYDVVANLKVTNEVNDGTATYYIGSVAGTNYGAISGMLVGGQITYTTTAATHDTGFVGGVVGQSICEKGESNSVKLSTAMALNLDVQSSDVHVGGIVGSANKTTIENVKFVSVQVINGNITYTGTIVGYGNIGGIAAEAENSTITYSSVESFIEKIKDKTKEDEPEVMFYTLENKSSSTTTAGLVASISGTNVENSFVSANISSLGTIYLTTNITNSEDIKEYNTYFIGKVDGTVTANNTTFSIVNDTIYKGTDAQSINVSDWETFVIGLVSGENWKIQENYNVVKINGVELFFPYLLGTMDENKDDELDPLMIVEPQSITANLDTKYVKDNNSVYVKEFNIEDYENKIIETVIVNFFNGASNEDNAHRLISEKDKNNGLLDVTLLPEDAQGGYAFEIVGDGYRYAYINSSKQIVFTGASGQTPIIVRIYSVFNTKVKYYVAFYSQCLMTDLELSSNSIYHANEKTHDYEISVYSGQSNKIITLVAENVKNENSCSSLFDVRGIGEYLTVETVVKDKEENVISKTSLLEVVSTSFDNIALRIAEGKTFEDDYFEYVTFTLYVKANYFGTYATENIPVGSVTLKVKLFNSATNIAVDGDDAEISTLDDYSFKVDLTTDWVNKDYYEKISETKVETVIANKIDENNSELLVVANNTDGIRITLTIVEGLAQVNKLISENENVSCFADLFVDNCQIISSLYTLANGYSYSILLEIKDEHTYRLITENIKFNIVVSALSNPNVNNSDTPIEILLKPTTLTTARIENYAVNTLNVNTDYTDIVTNADIETSIVEPGSLGNVMMIYLEPTYSHVTHVSIKTSELYVPALGKNVQMKFTQLVLDERKGTKGVFTTLYGGENITQVGDTLELQLISSKDKDGNSHYNGVICVYIQLEDFSGLEATITAELNVTTTNGKVITRTRDLLTTYLPGTKMEYDSERAIDGGYLIQKGTSLNEVKIKIFGYQFNSNPDLEFVWNLPDDSDYTYVGSDKFKIKDGTTTYLIGNYISYNLSNNYDEVEYNSFDDSYTISLMLNVAKDIPASFSVSATLTLTTKDGQLKTSKGEENTIVFYPTEYILNSVYVSDLVNNRKNIAINKTKQLELMFTTDNVNNDLSSEIYKDLLAYINKSSIPSDKMASLFTYYHNGGIINFADTHPEFEYNFVNESIVSITGISTFNSSVTFTVYYGYGEDKNGLYKLSFGEVGSNGITTSISFTFTLNVYAVNDDEEILINSADEIYNPSTGTWDLVEGGHYVLMNDIVLENVTPITTEIASFDGNNRVISIKSFSVDPENSNFGLFASIGTYTIKDEETEQTTEHQTILKNMIVDYSNFEETLALNQNTSENIFFGGLVAENKGGLIYNCDVMNLNVAKDAEIDIIVASGANVVFGGLVGENTGVITNSRVGRDGYTRIIATKTTESSMEVKASGLTFNIFNKEGVDSEVNQFSIVSGGFVGSNSGTISTSYVANTNLFNHSTNETTNITAGFVGKNNGTISYSYAKADEDTISTSNPYATGYKIENKGNGIVAGFVYANTGEISNAYANLELATKSAYIAGFVYNNSGTISESYAACTMNAGNINSNAEQPFVGVDNANNLLSTGKLENTYYLMRSETDTPFTQNDLDIAQGLNSENFQDSENLSGFAFILSSSKAERDQGIWSYYTLDSKKRILPELVNANIVSHSYRFVMDTEAANKILTNSSTYAEGTANNPYTISNVEEFNEVFTSNGIENSYIGYVRLINDINFNNDETAIQTRANYTLGSSTSSTKTSVEGNGMKISGIYLDVGEAVVNEIGLFANVQNAYIKNLSLEFATPSTDGQFSTTTSTYSGGLAGTIKDSVIININLTGSNTTLTGKNFVGGLAGIVTGSSLVYGVETNLNVKASSTSNYLYYNKTEYDSLNVKAATTLEYSEYLGTLSYAGGLAGVLDLTKRSNIEYNVQYIDIRGDQMSAKTFDGKQEANILAEYAGGVAGYASISTASFKLRYFMGDDEIIRGDTAVGGIYAVALGEITASQVTEEDEIRFEHDTTIGEYIIALQTDKNATLDDENIGNLKLLESYGYAGGLVGLSLGASVDSSYSKASIYSGETVGGLIGLAVASKISYSYAIPYINFNDEIKTVGGLIGSAYGVETSSPSRNDEISTYEKLVKYKGHNDEIVDIQFAYSTLILNNSDLVNNEGNAKYSTNLDYICANYQDETKSYIGSNGTANMSYVYAGTVNYMKDLSNNPIVKNQTKDTSKSSVMELYRLFNVGDSDQTVAFQEVFSGWSVKKYWSLKEEKYFPLLNNDAVENFIEIKNEADLSKITSNLEGYFKVTQSFSITDKTLLENNWIISGLFEGMLIGEIEGSDSRPVISIYGLKPQTPGETSGFFEKTMNATISNLEFEWVSTDSNPAIDMSAVGNLTIVSGLTCDDNNSLISNVEVRTIARNNDKTIATNSDACLINESGKTISGFGGIVGTSINTNILGCNFVGKINAVLNADNTTKDVYFGGIVGHAETEEPDKTLQVNYNTSVINNSYIGASGQSVNSKTYPKTSFNLTIQGCKPAYIGGIVGQASNSAIASSDVGGVGYTKEYQHIDMYLILNNTQNVLVGGIVGSATNGTISNCEVLTNITMTGETSSPEIKVAGLAGQYSVSAGTLTSGVSKSNTKATIKTYDENNMLTTSKDTHVMLSTGVAEMITQATMSQCLFTGEINTEGSDITILYVGGAVARVASGNNSTVSISEVSTAAVLIAGTSTTNQLYVGGLVGKVNKVKISYSNSWERIVPITAESLTEENSGIYAGGLIGLVETSAFVFNSYTTSSIIADSIASNVISDLNVGALVGAIPDGSTTENITFSNVYYSSDLALFADENYLSDGSALGVNLSAQTMIYGPGWHNALNTEDGEGNTFWTSFSVNSYARLPYLTSLEEGLKNFDILSSDYVEGSVMRPEQISGSSVNFDSDEYKDKYTYFLLVNTTSTQTPTFMGTLNGMLIGQDLDIDATFTVGTLSKKEIDGGDNVCGIVAEVGKHSAISNLNVRLTGAISQSGVVGVIAGMNNGVIFNSSVQGSGIKFTGSGTAGLIAGKNKGLISYCYSSAEIISTSMSLGGIVGVNGGKLMSDYFTGYIETSSNVNVAGIAAGNDTGPFIYNCYMTGVINGGRGSNNFSATTFSGTNNFIDYYSDIEYAKSNDINGLTSVSTASLMAGAELNGHWYTTVIDGAFKRNENGNITSSSNPTFGTNYNYPIYTFNKQTSNDGGKTFVPSEEWKNQLYTGTGASDFKEELYGVLDKNSNETFDLDERYSALISSNSSSNYKDAFKIPHLGVLTAIQNLLDKDLNYVVIYDLDGLNDTWTAIGTNDNNKPINGYVLNDTSKTNFKGVFVTNKYFAYNTSTDGTEICTIQNLSGNGLFANVENAYLGSIRIGNFRSLSNSGPLGSFVEGETAVNDISYVSKSEKTTISGSGTSSNYYGALFGEVNGKLTVNQIETDASAEPTLMLQGGDNNTVGLIAGKLSGTIELASGKGSTFYALFAGNNYAGGLVGEMVGGKITGNSYTVNIVNNQTCVNTLGGIVGKASGEWNITDLNVNLNNPSTGEVTIRANTFGGIVGETIHTDDKKGTVENVTLSTSSATFALVGNKSEGRYYGLVVGLQKGEISVSGFALSKEGQTADITMKVQTETAKTEYSEEKDNFGVGTFVGKQEANLTLGFSKFTLTIKANGLPNLGGVTGYYQSGQYNITNEKIPDGFKLTLKGTTNVGGLIGYCVGVPTFDDDSKLNLLTSNRFATIEIEGYQTASLEDTTSYKNFGGLIGHWNVSDKSSVSMRNSNSIKILSDGDVYNVGGVVGKISTKANIDGLTNNASFSESINNPSNEISKLDSGKSENGVQTTTKLINVGGIVGTVSASTDVTLSNLINSQNVIGYQNVGGLVGYVAGKVSIINSNSIKEEGATEIELSHDGSTLNGGILGNEISGNIYGVINVGGAVGYAGNNVIISQIYSKANVYGNTNVGGLVGSSNGASLTNNYLLGKSETKTDAKGNQVVTQTNGLVKGIYYNYIYQKIANGTAEEFTNSFIPTSVGGLIGYSTTSTLKNNVLDGVKVASSKESEGSVISTIKNYISYGVGNISSSLYNLDEKSKVEYSSTGSGYGGYVGTYIYENTTNENNYMNNIIVSAQLGINVGTYYGVYDLGSSDLTMKTPSLYGSTNVSGAYNVGGIAGFLDGSVQGSNGLKGLTNDELSGSATITLQNEFTGMYVGGLVGKTNANNIVDFNILSGQNVNIQINTDNCYYAGGLIGRAEVAAQANILGNVGIWTQTAGTDTQDDTSDDEFAVDNDEIISGTDKVANIGGLIGMLKVGQNSNGISVTVSGKHNYAFTINTIENSNYYDGDSEFSTNTDNGLALEAEAYYINKDEFNISGSSNKLLYSNNLEDVKNANGEVIDPADCNPLNKDAKGWSKEYTGFRILQRNIPQSSNNGAFWDSIAVLYDAAQITHVGTIGNLGREDYWMTKDDESGQFGRDFGLDYICFTVYEQADGQATLYSPIGIASIYYESGEDESGEEIKKYATPKDNTISFKGWFNGFVVNQETPDSCFYIDLNASAGCNCLTYFEWDSKYTSIGGTKEVPYQYNADVLGTDLVLETANSPRYLTYFVDGYLDGNLKYVGTSNHIDKETAKGVYFVFDVVYENASSNGLSYDNDGDPNTAAINITTSNDEYLPTNGSIFNVSGIMGQDIVDYLNNENQIDWFKINSKFAMTLIEIAILVVSGGGSAAVKGFGKAAKAIGKAVLKFAKKHWLVTIIGLVLIGNQTLQFDSTKAYDNFTQPSEVSYGYISTTYSREISYEMINGKTQMTGASDYMYENDDGDLYKYYSYVRPQDYHTNKYVGIQIELNEETDNTYTALLDEDKSDGAYVSIENGKLTETPKTYEVTMEGETVEILVGKVGEATYMLSPKYEYKNGQYYVFAYYGDVDYRRTTLNFEPETFKDYDSDEIWIYKKPNYIKTKNNIYVHGFFDNDKGYSYYLKDTDDDGIGDIGVYPGNNVTYDGNYKVNGVTLTNATYSNEKMNYEKVSYKPDYWIEGYDYFDTVYYSVNGEYKDYVKYAEFKYEEEATSLDYENLDYGKKGVDYIVEKYMYSDWTQSETGTHLMVESDYVEILNSNRYNIIDGVATQNNEGSRLKVGSNYVEILSTNRYNEPVYNYGLFLNSGSFSSQNKETDLTSSKYNTNNPIVREVYLSTFVNPYEKTNALSISELWAYTNETTDIVQFAPTYYVYEGGYVATNTETDKKADIFLPLDESYYKSGENYATLMVKSSKDATPTEVGFDELIADWSTKYGKNGTYYIGDQKLTDIYQVKYGKLYRYNLNYTLVGGLLHKMYITINQDDGEIDLNEGLYLTDNTVGLYTRYKYSVSLDNITNWEGYEIIPENGSTTINNGKTTRLTESVRVVLGGGKEIRVSVDAEDNWITTSSGSISIN